MIQRRYLLPVFLTAGSLASAEGAHFTYDGAEGPEHWGELSPDFATCGTGAEQSPIDLRATIPADAQDIDLAWQTGSDWQVVNNGHTIQVNLTDAGAAVIDGKSYALAQFHFHNPSEHAVAGTRAPMEAHFVHKAEDGALAVLGVMLTGGGDNALLDAVMAAAPAQAGEADLAPMDIATFLPAGRSYFRYQGSLTTPPCSEIVVWTVLQEPLAVSDGAIAAFAGIFPMNARPLQPTNRRYILAE